MPWPVYSERLLTVRGFVGWTQMAVPPGKRAIVKAGMFTSGAPSGAAVNIAVAGVVIYTKYFQVQYESFQFTTALVAYAGELIQAGANTTAVTGAISGYLLDDAAGRELALDDYSLEPFETFEPLPSLSGSGA